MFKFMNLMRGFRISVEIVAKKKHLSQNEGGKLSQNSEIAKNNGGGVRRDRKLAEIPMNVLFVNFLVQLEDKSF